MFTFILIILVGLLAAAGIFIYIQYNVQLNRATGNTSSNNPVKRGKSTGFRSSGSDTRWKAVKIKTGLMCCQAAERMRSQVYLTAEAPVFPLEGCTVKKCDCKYIHLNDRREEDDRRETTDFLNDLYDMHGKDRRKMKDRRQINL